MRTQILPIILSVIFVILCGCKKPDSPQKVISNMEFNQTTEVSEEETKADSTIEPIEENSEVEAVKTNPVATIETSKGAIVIELYPEAAPKTVENFVKLIESKFYDGLTFHRHVPGFVIQGGDPDGNGTGGPGWNIPGEFQIPELAAKMPSHVPGVLAMARSGHPDSAGSQFYICLGSAPHLDGNYTSFGRVTEGMNVVKNLRQGDLMTKVTIEE